MEKVTEVLQQLKILHTLVFQTICKVHFGGMVSTCGGYESRLAASKKDPLPESTLALAM